ncbi:MAG: imidazole glycerol phosphate synthase subunit HisF [Bacteroidetes bacterium]|nr:imidazole glycerol phosphate synthase subunit HisF [Bacteroidota bacterium]MBL0015088.1 imidazole glycerol phosphate synthase subunit HisF [Bacteroidota bacterium]
MQTAAIRVIPRLDIKGPNLVKGIHLEGLRVLGKPEEFARHYYENGADELFFQDVVASLYERNSLHDIVSKIAREIFIPLTVGGGLRSLEDIRSVLRAGADKVAINTAALKQPDIVRQAALDFGSSTIVVAIEAIRESDGRYLAYTDNGREYTGREVVAWAQEAEALGAGEIVITSVDREGTGEGYDAALTRKVADAVRIPVIAHGGPGKLQHIQEVLTQGGASAIAVAGMLHYDYIGKFASAAASATEGNTEFLRSGRIHKHFETCTLPEIKNFLLSQGLPCRPFTPIAQ